VGDIPEEVGQNLSSRVLCNMWRQRNLHERRERLWYFGSALWAYELSDARNEYIRRWGGKDAILSLASIV